jgi:hypothetical protein
MCIIGWNCRSVGSPHTIPSLKYLIRVWNKNHFKCFKHDIVMHRKRIGRLHSWVAVENWNLFNALRKHMAHPLVQEDAYWHQRSKTHCLRDGDLNTKFFHDAATSQRKVNRTNSLFDPWYSSY